MELRGLMTAMAVAGSVALPAARAQPGAPQDPNSIRIESRDTDEAGKRIDLPQFPYIGSPTLSRDGEWVAFDAYSGGFQGEPPACWIVKTDGTGLRKLCDGATPRWSPDGKQILFMREREKDRKLGPGLGIYLINSDGSREKRIADGRWPDWSPDGKKMSYSVGGKERRGGARARSRVMIANLDGTEADEVAHGDCSSWSPDGKKIACCFADAALPAPLIRVVDLDAQTESFAGYGWFRANWSSDGKSLYANGVAENGRPGMFRLSVAGGQKPEPIFPDVAGAESPSESWNGKRVVFVAPGARP